MKGYEKWAIEDGRKVYPAKDADLESVRKQAFIRGLRFGLEHAASLVDSFGNPKHAGLAILIRAIGSGEVDVGD